MSFWAEVDAYRPTLNGKGVSSFFKEGKTVAGCIVILFLCNYVIFFSHSPQKLYWGICLCASPSIWLYASRWLSSPNYCHEYLCFCCEDLLPRIVLGVVFRFGSGKVTAGNWTPAVVLQEHTLSGKSSGQVWIAVVDISVASGLNLVLNETFGFIKLYKVFGSISRTIELSSETQFPMAGTQSQTKTPDRPGLRDLRAPTSINNPRLYWFMPAMGKLNRNRFSLMHISQKQIAVECH